MPGTASPRADTRRRLLVTRIGGLLTSNPVIFARAPSRPMLQPAVIVSPRIAVAALLFALSLALTGAAPARQRAVACASAGGKSSVKAPRFVRNIATGETGWFASPGLVDLNGDGKLEIVAPFYSTFVFDANGRLLGKGTATKGRVYAPGVVADLDGDKVPEIVVGGNEGTVAAYDLVGGQLQLKPGWPASTCSGGQCPEARGMAAADLDGDGRVEVVVTTTNTSATGSQVFVFDASGAARTARRARRRRRGRATTRCRARATTPTSTASATTATAPTARTSASATSTTTRSSRSSSRSTTTRSTSSTTTARRCSRRRGSRTARAATPAARLGWGQFIRWLSPTVEDEPLPPPRRRLARRAHDAVAAVDGLAAVGRRPRRRRAERGHRAAERRDEGAVRDAGLRVHGARRRAERRRAVGAPARGLRRRCR